MGLQVRYNPNLASLKAGEEPGFHSILKTGGGEGRSSEPPKPPLDPPLKKMKVRTCIVYA